MPTLLTPLWPDQIGLQRGGAHSRSQPDVLTASLLPSGLVSRSANSSRHQEERAC